MKESFLDIVCVCGRHALEYANLLRRTGEFFSSGKYKLNWYCVTTPKNREVPEGFIKLLDLHPSSSEAGIIHAEGLMEGLKHVKSQHVLFTDSDIAILKKNWDVAIMDKISKECPIVGFEFGSGFEKECYQDFPSITFCLFKTHILRDLNVDLRQGDHLETVIINNEEESQIYNIKVGRQHRLETGWRLPLLYKKAGYKGYVLKKIEPFDKKSKLVFKPESSIKRTRKRWVSKKVGNNIMHEFYLDYDLIASHMRRSRKYHYDCKMSEIWRSKIDHYLRKTYKVSLESIMK